MVCFETVGRGREEASAVSRGSENFCRGTRRKRSSSAIRITIGSRSNKEASDHSKPGPVFECRVYVCPCTCVSVCVCVCEYELTVKQLDPVYVEQNVRSIKSFYSFFGL